MRQNGGLRNGGFLAHRNPQGTKMRQKSNSTPVTSEKLVRDIRRATRKQYSAEEKIRIILDGLRGETPIAELCRREGIAERHVLVLVEGVPRGWQAPACWGLVAGRRTQALPPFRPQFRLSFAIAAPEADTLSASR